MRDLRTLWKVFKMGDHLDDDELNALIKDARSTIGYLSNRGETFHLAWKETNNDLMAMEGYAAARRDAKRRREFPSMP